MKKTPILIAVIVVIIGIIVVAYYTQHNGTSTGSTVATSTAATSTADGSTQAGGSTGGVAAAHGTYVNASANDIIVASPTPGATVGTSFNVNGQARGTWYFEASFPIEVIGSDGSILYQHPAAASGDWMTTSFVPFTVTMTVSHYTGPATLVLMKDNPSGNPDMDASLKIPIMIENPADVTPVNTPIGN